MVSSKGKLKVNPSRLAEDHRVVNNVGIRDFKVYSEGKKIKVFGRESSGADGIDVAKNLLMPMRKSLQNTEGVHLTDLSNLKGCAKSSVKSKSKGDSSVKVKVGRKVLADVSNVKSYTLRKQSSDGVKLVNTKSETSGFLKGKFHSGRNIYGSGVSVGQITTIASVSSRKPAMGIMRTNETSGANSKSLKKADIKGFKIYTDHPKTKGRDNGSFDTNERKFAKEPLILNRKSFPVKSGPVQFDSNDLKGNVKNSEKCAEKCAGNSVKVKIGRKVMPAVSNEKSYLWRTRRSDGFISVNCGMDKRSQGIPVDPSVKGASALTKKPIRPIGRTRLTVSGAQTASKPQGLKKSITGTTSTSKREEELSRNYVPKNIELVVSDESSQEKVPLPSDGDSYTRAKSTNIISATKYNRRKSFTSSIVARSEVLRVCPEIVKPEELPNIDDNTNHLEVVEYVDDLYQYYWVMEAQNPSLANYMATQTDITAKMRGILINWLIEVHHKFDLMQETLFLMVLLFDKFLSTHIIKKNDVQLVGLTSLLLASKYEDFWHPKVKDLISISAESYTRHQMLAMEKLILKKLMFRLNTPTPYVFMIRFLKASQSDTKLEQLAFYLIELCLVEYEALNFKPSLLCASAIYVARCTLQITPGWSPLLVKHSHYEEPQLRLCASMILRFQKGAGRGSLKVTYEKFMQPDRSCVAAVKALDRLPQ